MKWLTLDKIKDHLRISRECNDEDELLEEYGASAEEAILNTINRTYEDLMETYGEVPAPIRHASLLITGDGYLVRESWTQTKIETTPTFSIMLKPYVRSEEHTSELQSP